MSPSGESKNASCEVLSQRRFGRALTMPPFEKRLTGRIDVKCYTVRCEKDIQTDIRLSPVNGWAFSAQLHESVADRVFDPKSQKVQTRERTVMRSHFDLDGTGRSEPLQPVQPIGSVINVFVRAIRILADLPHDPAGDMTLEIHPIHRGPGSMEANASGGGVRVGHSKFVKLGFQNALKSSWTRCKESMFCAIHWQTCRYIVEVP